MMRLVNEIATTAVAIAASLPTLVAGAPWAPECQDDAVRFEIGDAPYTNYFYSDCHSASQVVVTSPLPDSNLAVIGPRLLVFKSPRHDRSFHG
jgi:hypothetical protein